MSRMSAPQPIYQFKRPEDINSLNQILTNLSIDERLRIKAILPLTITKTTNTYTATASTTVSFSGIPAVIGMVDIGGGTWGQLPYMTSTGASTLAINEHVYISSVTSDGSGLVTITVKANCDTTKYGLTVPYTVKLIVLKDVM